MSKIQRIIFEYEDKTMECVGEEAQKLDSHLLSLCVAAQNRSGNQNPFAHDPVKWRTITGKTPEERLKWLAEGIAHDTPSFAWHTLL